MAEPEPIACPFCRESPLMNPDSIDVCSACGRSLVVSHGIARMAMNADLQALSPQQIAELRHKRGAIVRPK